MSVVSIDRSRLESIADQLRAQSRLVQGGPRLLFGCAAVPGDYGAVRAQLAAIGQAEAQAAAWIGDEIDRYAVRLDIVSLHAMINDVFGGRG